MAKDKEEGAKDTEEDRTNMGEAYSGDSGCEIPKNDQLALGSIRDRLEYLRQLVQESAESDAVKELGKDVETLTKIYDGLPDIIAKYRLAHKDFVGSMKDEAKRQWDDLQSWTDDEVAPPIKNKINKLAGVYAKKSGTLETELSAKTKAFRSQKSCLDQARDEEADAQSTFDEAKNFEAKAKAWFTDLTSLHKDAKGYLEAKEYEALYAVSLEFKDIYGKVQELETAKNPEWLKQELRKHLQALIDAKYKRFYWHRDWLDKKEASEVAKKDFDAFKESRRRDFIRDAKIDEAA